MKDSISGTLSTRIADMPAESVSCLLKSRHVGQDITFIYHSQKRLFVAAYDYELL